MPSFQSETLAASQSTETAGVAGEQPPHRTRGSYRALERGWFAHVHDVQTRDTTVGLPVAALQNARLAPRRPRRRDVLLARGGRWEGRDFMRNIE